jgi:hypothetical protein
VLLARNIILLFVAICNRKASSRAVASATSSTPKKSTSSSARRSSRSSIRPSSAGAISPRRSRTTARASRTRSPSRSVHSPTSPPKAQRPSRPMIPSDQNNCEPGSTPKTPNSAFPAQRNSSRALLASFRTSPTPPSTLIRATSKNPIINSQIRGIISPKQRPSASQRHLARWPCSLLLATPTRMSNCSATSTPPTLSLTLATSRNRSTSSSINGTCPCGRSGRAGCRGRSPCSLRTSTASSTGRKPSLRTSQRGCARCSVPGGSKSSN